MRRDEQLEQVAAGLYDASLPYHNFRHALEAVEAGARIVRRCQAENVRIDPDVVYYALLFHDAGYHENHRLRGFESKEAYSAHLAARALAARDVDSRVVRKVQAAILSTRRDGSFRTAEQKAVRAADLAALAADYPTFKENTERLWAEYRLLSGESIAWGEYVQKAAAVIRFYLTQEVRLTSFFAGPDGRSDFHRRTRANLERLLREESASHLASAV